ncbi:MAG: hypothetical protein LBQ59_05760 [Candidatus Peribacteria bacterium]|jgi:hypothetical protein|nr:hypothetical protein [Candidatus Peribacteria bacterium]
MDPKLNDMYEKELEKLNLELTNEQDQTKRKQIEEEIQTLTEEKGKILSGEIYNGGELDVQK